MLKQYPNFNPSKKTLRLVGIICAVMSLIGGVLGTFTGFIFLKNHPEVLNQYPPNSLVLFTVLSGGIGGGVFGMGSLIIMAVFGRLYLGFKEKNDV